MDYFVNLLLPLIDHIGIISYWLIFLISFIETLAFVGILIPGTLFVIFTGFLSSQGYLNIYSLIIFAAAGAILGDLVSFYLGKKSTSIFSEDSTIFNLGYLQKGENFFKRHGNKSIVLSRFIGPLRAVMPFVAGIFKMNYKKFLLWDIIGALIWAIAFILGGYFFGQAWNVIETWTSRVTFFGLSVLVFLFMLWLIRLVLIRTGEQILIFVKSFSFYYENKFLNSAFALKHKRFFNFLQGRINRTVFSGLPLTLLSLTFFVFILLFSGATLLNFQFIVNWDSGFWKFLTAFRHEKIVDFFLWVTFLGNWQVVIFFAVILSFLLWSWKKQNFILPLWISLLGGGALGRLGKFFLYRPRPDFALYPEKYFSFPSAHTIIAVTFYGFLAYIFWHLAKRKKSKYNFLFGGLIMIVFVSFSRLYLGVHYLSDVFGGFLLGSAWLFFGISLVRLFKKTDDTLIVNKLVLSLTLISALSFYIVFGSLYYPLLSSETKIISSQNILPAFSQEKLPKFSETLTGKLEIPLNIIIVTDEPQKIVQLFKENSWHLADKLDSLALYKAAKTGISKNDYLNSPLKNFFWRNESQTFGFKKTGSSKNKNHEVRFWKTNLRTADDKLVFVGVSSLNTEDKWFLRPKTDLEIDDEREFLMQNIIKSNLISSYSKKTFLDFNADSLAQKRFFTDGKIYVINLK